MVSGVRYARTFFDLQLRFAARVVDLSGLPLARALLEYTNLYVRLDLGRDFDPDHPIWREYVAGLHDARDPREWTYRVYLTRADAAPPVVASVGCFGYALASDGSIRLHFRNAEPDAFPPLSVERIGRRRAELAALFAQVRRTLPEPPQVIGASWLYNLEGYRRLFPPSYLATARVLGGRFQHMPLWGQFLDRRGEVRERATRPFLDRLERQASMDGLDDCFPLPVLAVAAPAEVFYEFYEV